MARGRAGLSLQMPESCRWEESDFKGPEIRDKPRVRKNETVVQKDGKITPDLFWSQS